MPPLERPPAASRTGIPPSTGVSNREGEEARMIQDAFRFRTLCESGPLGIFECDRAGELIYRNRQLAEILGLENSVDFGADWVSRIHPDDRDALMNQWAVTKRDTVALRHDYRLVLPSGEQRWLRVHVMPTHQQEPSFVGMLEDITERRNAQEAVRESEERFRQIAENIDEVFWVTTADMSEILYVSDAVEKVWGRPPREFYDKPAQFLDYVYPDDRQRIAEQIPKLQQDPYDGMFRIVQPGGSVRTVRVRAFPVRNEQGVCYRLAGVTQDITQARRVEEELRTERRFLEHLLQVQEGERKLIAYDIHDGFVQSVIGALMHLEGISADAATTESVRTRLDVPVQLLRESIAEARRMISGLRPPILDEQGLVAAIEYLISEHADRKIRFTFEHHVQFHRLEPVIEGTLFRIVQEALTNVYRHSRARQASIRLTQSDDRVVLVIEDWGIGFNPRETTSRQFGLRGIRERAKLFGGKAVIHSAPGSGTRISVEIPLTPDASTSGPIGS